MVNNNFYLTINELVTQASSGEVTGVIDYETFIDAGRTILDIQGTDLQNNFISALMNKIALSINTFRSYNGKYKELVRGTVTSGNTIEMIMNQFYETQAAAFVSLADNGTVDQYEIHKPKIEVKYYTETNAYSIPITIQRDQLIKAWENPASMDSFIAGVTGSVLNSNEFAREKGRIGMVAGLITYVYDNGDYATTEDEPAQIYKLVTLFNNRLADSSEVVNADTALRSEKFIKFAVETIKKVLRKVESPSTEFNSEGIITFTPDYSKHLFVNGALTSAMDTHIYTNNYNPEYSILKDYIMVDYWQNAKKPLDVAYNHTGNDVESNVTGVLALVCDYYTIGEYLKEQSMDTTPYNARGKYWNNWLNVETRYITNNYANAVIFVLE